MPRFPYGNMSGSIQPRPTRSGNQILPRTRGWRSPPTDDYLLWANQRKEFDVFAVSELLEPVVSISVEGCRRAVLTNCNRGGQKRLEAKSFGASKAPFLTVSYDFTTAHTSINTFDVLDPSEQRSAKQQVLASMHLCGRGRCQAATAKSSACWTRGTMKCIFSYH